MKSILIKGSIVVLAFLILTLVYLLTSSKHADLWKKDKQTLVFFNGQFSGGSVVYRKSNGAMIINTAEDGWWYLLNEQGQVCYCDSFAYSTNSSFTVQLPGYLYAWRKSDYPCLESVKFNIDSGMLVGTKSIEFNSARNMRIRVAW